MRNLFDLVKYDVLLTQITPPDVITRKKGIAEVLSGLASPIEEFICVLYLILILLGTVPIIIRSRKTKI